MNISKCCGVVLAGGTSSRMSFNKLTAQLAGHSLVWYPVKHLRDAGIQRIIVVVGHDRVKVKKAIGNGVDYAMQEQQLGTGHAAAQAVPLLANEELVVVLFGDCPFLDGETIKEAISTHIATKADLTIGTAILKDPRALGRVYRDQDQAIKKIVDGKFEAAWEMKPAEVFAGLSIWSRSTFQSIISLLPRKQKSDSVLEYDLPDSVELLRREGGTVASFDVAPEDALAPNLPVEFELAGEYFRLKIRAALITSDVAIPDPYTVRVDYDVTVGQGTELRANTHLLGNTRVGRGCEIGPDATLRDCTVGDNCVIGKGSWTGQQFPLNSVASDRLATEHRYFRRPHYLIPEDPSFAFVLMPFNEPYSSQFENIIRPTVVGHGLDCKIASDSFTDGVVIEDIWLDINRASLVIAEVSEPNPNVWYELGLAHALNKPVMLLLRESAISSGIPFDVSAHRILVYNPEKGDLAPKIKQWLAGMSTRT
jgi:bifunctional UDP-N-acetylglucosamine pyrophosphorylase/glucosamine-1-phosphate N-acetyltransferase